MCVNFDELFVFWKANDPSNAIYFSVSNDGMNWPAGQLINSTDSTPQPPAACVYNDEIYLFWTANDPSNLIYYTGGLGAPWPGGQLIDSSDTTSLALTAVVNMQGPLLQLFWQGNDSFNIVYSTAQGFISGPLPWPTGTQVGALTTRGRGGATTLDAYMSRYPLASCVFLGSLLLFWTANDSSGAIDVGQIGSQPFYGSNAATAIPDAAATTGPTVCVLDTVNGPVLYLFWTATNTICFRLVAGRFRLDCASPAESVCYDDISACRMRIQWAALCLLDG